MLLPGVFRDDARSRASIADAASRASRSRTWRASIRTSSITCWTAPATCSGRARCIRSSTAASTGTPACTATGCWRAPAALSRASPRRRAIRALFDAMLTPEKVAGELAYLARPSSRGLRAALRLGLAAHAAGELARHRRRSAGPPRSRRSPRRSRSASTTFLPEADLSDPHRHAFQHRVRVRARARVRGRARRGARAR